MKNGMLDLNDHLFAQLERLAEPDLTTEQLEAEISRSQAMVSVADRITDNAKTRITAARLFAEHGHAVLDMLPAVGHSTTKQISDQSGGDS